MTEIRGTTGMLSQAEQGLKLFEAQVPWKLFWSKWHEAVDFDVDHGFRKQPLTQHLCVAFDL